MKEITSPHFGSRTTRKAQAAPRRADAKKITSTYLHNAGLYYLERHAASAGHFKAVMTRKIDRSCAAHPEQDRAACLELLDALVARFIESGLLNDNLYAEGVFASLSRRGLPLRTVARKMAAKKIDPALIETLVASRKDDEPDSDMQAGLRFARRKKIGPYAAPARHGEDRGEDIEKKRRKAEGQMARAGFGYDCVRKILSMSAEEAEEAGN